MAEDDGDVLERYLYDPYGNVTFLKADWSLQEVSGHDDGTASAYDNPILFAGYYRDSETLLYHVRNRMYHAKLGLWLQRDPQGYVDGMSLYAYVGGCPLTYVDAAGLIRIITGNKDINDAYKKFSTTKSGRRLIRRIEMFERRTGQEVLVNITGTSAAGSAERAIGKGDAIFVVDAEGKCRKITAENNGSYVEINPEHAVSESTTAVGDGPEDVVLGKPVDEALFHELSHSEQRLAGRFQDNRKTALPAGSGGWTQQQKQQWLDRWGHPREHEAVMMTNEYRRELGRAARVRYKTTEAQNERATYLKARASLGGGYLPLRERPVYPFLGYNYDQKMRRVQELRSQGKAEAANRLQRRLNEAYRRKEEARPNIPIVP